MRKLRLTVDRLAAVLRAILGVPDYARYASHMRAHHPGAPLLSPGELLATRQRERFESPGGKCC